LLPPYIYVQILSTPAAGFTAFLFPSALSDVLHPCPSVFLHLPLFKYTNGIPTRAKQFQPLQIRTSDPDILPV